MRVSNKNITNKIKKSAPKVQLKALKFPAKLTTANFQSLLKFHVPSEIKFVFHVPTKQMSVGHDDSPHKDIAKATIKHKDMKIENNPNVVGGTIVMKKDPKKDAIHFLIEATSIFYAGNRELNYVFNHINSILKENMFKAIHLKKLLYPNKNPYYTFTVVKKGFSAFSFFFGK